jgi:hypothetical protein
VSSPLVWRARAVMVVIAVAALGLFAAGCGGTQPSASGVPRPSPCGASASPVAADRRQPARVPVTANRSTAATCPPVAAAMVITWPGVARKVTLADYGLRVPPAAWQQ